MNPGVFIDKWSRSGGAERANKDAFLAELCDVLGVPHPDPVTGDSEQDRYVFEADAFLLHEGDTHTTVDWGSGGTGRSNSPHAGIWIDTRDDCCKTSGRKFGDLPPGVSTFPGNSLPNAGIVGNSNPGGNPGAKKYCTTCEQDRKMQTAAAAYAASGVT